MILLSGFSPLQSEFVKPLSCLVQPADYLFIMNQYITWSCDWERWGGGDFCQMVLLKGSAVISEASQR